MSGVLRIEDLATAGPFQLRGITFEARPGEITALVGPNGSGKSTLLRAALGLIPATGRVRLGDQELQEAPRLERARSLAYVPQRTALHSPQTVGQVVRQGRYPHRSRLGRPVDGDSAAVKRAMDDARVAELEERPFNQLSGGERQRVLLARALATEAPVLLLDEPTSAQDVRHVLEIECCLRELTDAGKAVVVVLHDLAGVERLADHAVVLDRGELRVAGPPADALGGQHLSAVWGVSSDRLLQRSFRLAEGRGGLA